MMLISRVRILRNNAEQSNFTEMRWWIGFVYHAQGSLDIFARTSIYKKTKKTSQTLQFFLLLFLESKFDCQSYFYKEPTKLALIQNQDISTV